MLKYYWARLKNMLGNKTAILDYFKAEGCKIGENARIFSNIATSESYLIEIGDNVTISNNVQFITHDNSVIKVLPDATDVFGKICIGNNCFIGARSILMYGVSLPDNTIVAAGSVVTKSISESGKILGGNPAKVIGSVDAFAEKVKPFALNLKKLSPEEKKQLLTKDDTYLIKR